MKTKEQQLHVAEELDKKLNGLNDCFKEIIRYRRGKVFKIAIAFDNIFVPNLFVKKVVSACDELGVSWYISDTCLATNLYPLYINIY